jgi:hypothetical protein
LLVQVVYVLGAKEEAFAQLLFELSLASAKCAEFGLAVAAARRRME